VYDIENELARQKKAFAKASDLHIALINDRAFLKKILKRKYRVKEKLV